MSAKVSPASSISDALSVITAAEDAIRTALKGRAVRVTSDHNGQPYGNSKRSWRGEVRRIKDVVIDIAAKRLYLILEGHEWETPIDANEVEFP